MKKLPQDTAKLTGAYRLDRERHGLEAGAKLSEPPAPPAGLSDLAAEHWRELAPLAVSMGVLTPADLPLLRLACLTLETADLLAAAIEADGFLLDTASGNRKANPNLKILETTRNSASRMLNDFGLSPKSRKYVSQAPGRKADNRFAHLDE